MGFIDNMPMLLFHYTSVNKCVHKRLNAYTMVVDNVVNAII